MRKLIATLLLIFWPGLMLSPAQRSVFFSQNVRPTAGGGGGTVAYNSSCINGSGSSCTLTVAANSVVYVDAANFNASTLTLSDSGSNGGITLLGSAQTWFSSSGLEAVWEVKNVSSGSHTYTISYSGSPGTSNFPDIQVVNLTGASTTSPTDSSSKANGGAATVTCASLTTTSANEFLLAFASTGGGTTVTAAGTTPQAMTLVFSTGTSYNAEYGTAVAAGSHSAQFTLSAFQSWACSLVAVH